MAKVVFMGTPDFAVPTLNALIKHHDVIGVVTQPDRPAGRQGKIRVSPIKQVALDADIPVFQPEKMRRPEAIAELQQWEPDVFIVAAFGQILLQKVLDIPPHGSINVHASLLPRWRGAAPIHAAIRAGDVETGVTIMKMDAGVDTGPMLSQGKVPIDPDETGESLHDKLATLGADLLIHTLPGYLSGKIKPQPQPERGVTVAPQIKKEEGHIDWSMNAVEIERLIRAFTPWPGTYAYWDDRMLKILEASTEPPLILPLRNEVLETEPGCVVTAGHEEQVAITTGGSLLYPLRVQLAGKKPVAISDFLRGYPDFIGARLT